MSQSELAEALTAAGLPGLSKAAISRIESGARGLKFLEGVEAARALKVDPLQLAPATATEAIVAAEAATNAYVAQLKEAAANARKLEDARTQILAMIVNVLDQAPEGVGSRRAEHLRSVMDEAVSIPVEKYLTDALKFRPPRGRRSAVSPAVVPDDEGRDAAAAIARELSKAARPAEPIPSAMEALRDPVQSRGHRSARPAEVDPDI